MAGHVHLPAEGLLWGFFAGNVTAEDPGKWHLCDTYLPPVSGGRGFHHFMGLGTAVVTYGRRLGALFPGRRCHRSVAGAIYTYP